MQAKKDCDTAKALAKNLTAFAHAANVTAMAKAHNETAIQIRKERYEAEMVKKEIAEQAIAATPTPRHPPRTLALIPILTLAHPSAGPALSRRRPLGRATVSPTRSTRHFLPQVRGAR